MIQVEGQFGTYLGKNCSCSLYLMAEEKFNRQGRTDIT